MSQLEQYTLPSGKIAKIDREKKEIYVYGISNGKNIPKEQYLYSISFDDILWYTLNGLECKLDVSHLDLHSKKKD